MGYDVITHKKLDAVLEVLKDIRDALEAGAVVEVTEVPTINAEKLEAMVADSLVVKKARKKKENE